MRGVLQGAKLKKGPAERQNCKTSCWIGTPRSPGDQEGPVAGWAMAKRRADQLELDSPLVGPTGAALETPGAYLLAQSTPAKEGTSSLTVLSPSGSLWMSRCTRACALTSPPLPCPPRQWMDVGPSSYYCRRGIHPDSIKSDLVSFDEISRLLADELTYAETQDLLRCSSRVYLSLRDQGAIPR